jgi:urease accessory protein
MLRHTFAAAFLVLFPTVALAHTSAGAAFGFADGFWHPLGGLDHLLAMFAVGLLAAQLGGRALWLIPGAFLMMMIVGAFAGMSGVAMPGVEYAIGLSIAAIALPIAFALGMPVALAMTLVGVFAIFHGHAHGTEIPQDAAVTTYVLGFTMATALIHGAGVFSGLGLERLAKRGLLLRASGASIAALGAALVVLNP